MASGEDRPGFGAFIQDLLISFASHQENDLGSSARADPQILIHQMGLKIPTGWGGLLKRVRISLTHSRSSINHACHVKQAASWLILSKKKKKREGIA
jgi:hypothetical protein